jgi:hypothetical protein
LWQWWLWLTINWLLRGLYNNCMCFLVPNSSFVLFLLIVLHDFVMTWIIFTYVLGVVVRVWDLFYMQALWGYWIYLLLHKFRAQNSQMVTNVIIMSLDQCKISGAYDFNDIVCQRYNQMYFLFYVFANSKTKNKFDIFSFRVSPVMLILWTNNC